MLPLLLMTLSSTIQVYIYSGRFMRCYLILLIWKVAKYYRFFPSYFCPKELSMPRAGLLTPFFDIILFLKMEPDYSSEWDDMCV